MPAAQRDQDQEALHEGSGSGGGALQDHVDLDQEHGSSGGVAVLLWDGALDLHTIKVQGGKSEINGPKRGPVRV